MRNSVKDRLGKAWKPILRELKVSEPDIDEEIDYYEQSCPADFTLENFFGEYVWTVYCTGLRTDVIDGCWDGISRALRDFDVHRVSAERDVALVDLLTVFNNKVKANNVIGTAVLLAEHPKEWDRLQRMPAPEALDEVVKYRGIGANNRYHLLRSLGWDVPTHSGFTRTLVESLQTDPNTLVASLARESKLKISTTDIMLWRWSRLYRTQQEAVERFQTLIGLSA